MSWSAEGRAVNGALSEWKDYPQVGYGDAESVADIIKARELGLKMAAVLGGDVFIRANGHSNPNRVPERNEKVHWSTDCMSITVLRAEPA